MTEVVKKPGSSRRNFLLACGSMGAAALGAYALTGKWRAAAPLVTGAPGGLKLVSRKSRALGSDICMIVLHEQAAAGERALDAAFAELAHVERVMSIYLPETQVSRLNQNGRIQNADAYLLDVLAHSADMAKRSGGAFDISVQPLWVLYEAAKRQNKLPSDAEIDATRAKVDWRGIIVECGGVRLRDRGMAITLNGIAQGFAADRCMEALKRNGIQHALVNAGEIASLGRKQSGEPWTVGIQHPRLPDAYLGMATLQGRCISTSGDYETAFTEDKAYNHIFEPWSGRSPMAFSSVTVVAPTATEADALSTAIFVLGAEKGLELARSSGNVDVLVVTKDGRQMATEGFPWKA